MRRGVPAGVFSPDGRILAVASENHSLGLWEVPSGDLIHQLKGPGHFSGSLAFSPDSKVLASLAEAGTVSRGGFVPEEGTAASSPETAIHCWDVAAGQGLAPIPGEGGPLAFSPNGKTLASGGTGGTVLIWRFSGPDPQDAVRLSPAELAALWEDLAGADASRAYRAIGTLARAPGQTVPFFQDRLRPVLPAAPERIARLIEDLDSDRFIVRQNATTELEKLEELAGPALRETLQRQPTLEVRRRVEQLLDKLNDLPLVPERLRALRALAVLEEVSSSGARQVLARIARGAAEARLTREAKAALARRSRPSAS